MTEFQIALLTSNIFLAAWLGKHWMSGVLCIVYFVTAWMK